MSPTARTQIEFTVPAVPVGQPRVKAAVRNGRASVYTPSTVKNQSTGERKPHPIHAFKATVRLAAQQVYGGAPLDGPISIVAEFIMPRPRAKVWKTKPMPREPYTSKPDIDNAFKAICDSLNGLAFVDDAQVYSAVLLKYIAAGDEQPHVRVSISN